MAYDVRRGVTVVFVGWTGADNGQTWEYARMMLGDLNCDGAVNFADIDPFVALLSGG